MASRCTRTYDLEIHHVNRGGSNTLSNAEVLCHSCHVNTETFGKEGYHPDPFPESVKEDALIIAGNQCQCKRDNCH